MNILWLFPPCEMGALPNISQYRFFKYMPARTSIIYPYLASSGVTQLVQAGHHVDFMDCPTKGYTWDDVARKLIGADVVIFELRTPIYWQIIRAIKLVCTRSDARILVYGDHPTAYPEQVMRDCPEIDAIISGGNFDVGIKSYFEEKNPPKLYAFPFNGVKINLDDLPFVDRELVDWHDYYEAWRNRKNFLWTMSGRGCPYDCTFCAWIKCLWNNEFNMRSPKNVADEYEWMRDTYGAEEIIDDVDELPIRTKNNWAVLFSAELINRGLGKEELIWAGQTNPNEILPLGSMQFCEKGGLKTLKLGIESMNPDTLKIIRKGTTPEIIEKAIKTLKRANIAVHANMMVGFPWETLDDAYKTIDKIKELDPNQAQWSLVIPYPWTDLHKQAEENGWLLVEKGDWDSYDARSPMLTMVDATPEEIKKLYKECWSKFYLDWKFIIRRMRRAGLNLRDWGILWSGFKSIYYGHMRATDVG